MDVQVKSHGFETQASSLQGSCHWYGRLVLATAMPVMRWVGAMRGPKMSCGRWREMCDVFVPSGWLNDGVNVRSIDHCQSIPFCEKACRP